MSETITPQPFDRSAMTDKRQSKRKEKNVYTTTESSENPKYFALDMFPYPSGAGLHVGHPKGYIATDVISRKKHLEGYNVLHPMGFDSFGLPTENYAMKNKIHPSQATDENIATFIGQLKKIGFNYDRDRMVSTADPEFYKRTQRQFLQMYHHYFDHIEQKAKPISELREKLKGGVIAKDEAIHAETTNFQNRYQTQIKSDSEFFVSLTEEEKIEYYLDTEKRIAYISTAPINRCPSCMTALANEDLDGNNCERCGSVIERKKMRQWMIRITDYAQRLLDGLDLLPDRQDNIKAMQRHWIGKSEGTIVEFETVQNHTKIPVYTTRIDTIFGVTYVAIAPEYPDIEQYITPDQRATVLAYIEESKNKTDLQRQESKEKTGVRTGSYVINPFNNEQVPLRVADYVLMDYGTGAVMAVPAHDERDREFAHKYNLPIKEVIAKEYRGEGTSAPKEGIETLYRKTIDAIIENDRGEFLIMTEQNPIKSHFVGGGIDEGDSELETVKKEIIEETGYTDFKIIGPITGTYIHMVGYRHTKNKNQNTVGRFFHVKLNSNNKIHSEVDDGNHTIKWLPIEAVKESINRQHHQYAYEVFLSKGKVMTEKGTLTNSGEFDGLTSEEAIPAMQSRLTERGLGGKKTNYRLNNRVFSRQRYWGEPIPFVYTEVSSNELQAAEDEKTGSLELKDGSQLICLGSFKGSHLLLNTEKHTELANHHETTDDGCIHVVGCIVRDSEGKIYVHHNALKNEFFFPGGKVDTGETVEQASVRELQEELELTVKVSDVKRLSSMKVIHGGVKRCFHMVDILHYEGPIVDHETAKYDHYRAEIIPSDNAFGFAVKVDGTITDDIYDIMHTFVDIYNMKISLPQLNNDGTQGTFEPYDISSIDTSASYYQYYDPSQKKYFFDKEYQQPKTQDSQLKTDHNRIRVTPMDESELPLTLPDVAHYEPTGTEEGPLAKIESWINTTLEDGTPARRESNTMPGWAGSSRYRLRYMDPRNTQSMLSLEKESYRGQVDLYVGGMEHACRHLIYARFWHKFLKDIGIVSTEEPFKKLVGVGLVLAEDGRKMSKRRGNVINPDDVIAEFGTDAFRTYEMFMGPFGSEVARSTAGVKGVRKFLDKIIKLSSVVRHAELVSASQITTDPEINSGGHKDSKEYKKALTLLHKTIKKVTEDIDDFAFNTAISALMIYVNHLEESLSSLPLDLFEPLIQLIAPFAPHLAEELREKLGHTTMLYEAKNWPSYDPALLVDDVITMGVQFNGKMKGTIEIAPTATQEEALALVQADAKLASNFTGEVKKIIYVPGRILNIVVG